MPNILFIYPILFYSLSLAPLWTCLRQTVSNITQAVPLFSDVLQILFKLRQLCLLCLGGSKKYLKLPVKCRALHTAPEDLETCGCLVQHLVELLHVRVPLWSGAGRDSEEHHRETQSSM